MVLQVQAGLPNSFTVDSRVCVTQTRRLEANEFTLGYSLDSGVILEEEDEL